MEQSEPKAGPTISYALALAQGQIKAAKKTSENPAFSRPGKKSTYADLAEVIEVIQKPASDNGLSVIFDFKLEGETLFISYILMHSSGEKIISSPVPMFLRDKTLHGFGASNTFMRRQLLKAIYQIPEEDDDGNSASLPSQPAHPPAKPKIPNLAPKVNPESQAQPKDEYFTFDPNSPVKQRLLELQQHFQLSNKEITECIVKETGRSSSKECSDTELNIVFEALRKRCV